MRRALPYILPALLICGWWTLSFVGPSARPPSQIKFLSCEPNLEPSEVAQLGDLLSPLNRDKIKKALVGNTALMLDMIAEWDQDAQILESKGFHATERLSRKDFVRALTLGRSLKAKKSEPTGKKYFPQSWNSANFLLALTDPADIVAFPEGYKPVVPTSGIPYLKGDSSELLWRLKPSLAFVAAYTHPTVIQTLENLKIPLHHTETIWNLEDLFREIRRTGQAIKRDREAELITLFMKSALLAIDNRAKLLTPYPDTLYLSYGTYLSYPTKKMIAGQLAERLKLNLSLPQTNTFAWKISLDLEKLQALKPKRLIISCEEGQTHLHMLPDWKEPLEIALIPRSPIESLDQTVILAYYDLYEALAR